VFRIVRYKKLAVTKNYFFSFFLWNMILVCILRVKSNKKIEIMKKLMSSIIILILSIVFISADSSRLITGKVTDDQGAALPGVSVIIKNSKRGVVTDYNGEYKITVYPSDNTLIFSFIGYEVEEVKIEGKNIINVKMQASLVSVDEIVVAGIVAKESEVAPTVVGYGIRRADKKAAYDMSSNMSYYPAQPDWNTEGYSAIHENGYKEVLQQPLSTFSIDVDKASYSNVRRFINSGQLPPIDAVRTEELINYFNYDYPEPKDEHPFSVLAELSTCPWNTQHQLLHIGLKGKDIPKDNLPSSNLVFLLDVSGSMNSPNKLPLLKQSFNMLVNELRPSDRVAIVVYAGAAGLVLESTPGKDKAKIMESLDRLSAGGSTAGGEGLQLAYKVARENFIEDGNNRIILATDGDFNIGSSSNAEMERLIEKEREHGIFMTVLGFGMGNYKDDKMEIIADKGNGNYAYIDNIQEARKVMVSEFAGTLFTIAKDVKFQLEFNPKRVKSYRLIGYENRLLNDEDFNDDKKDAGEMGAGHTVTALYEIIPAGSDETTSRIDPLKYQAEKNVKSVKPDVSSELLTIKLRYKKPEGDKSILMERPVQGVLINFEESSENLRFTAAIAEFGMLLRDSEYLNDVDFDHMLRIAQSARGEDEEGYRGEFIKLAKTAKNLKEMSAKK
jgi:Ca-activated chloride channel homolog